MGWSQRELASRLGLSPGAVAQWETEAVRPTLANILAMQRLFGGPATGLIGAGRSYPGEVINAEEELLLLSVWRQLDPAQRQVLLHLIEGGLGRQSTEAAPVKPRRGTREV
jgi:transcriptional regulator with XRE-family HTH domain